MVEFNKMFVMLPVMFLARKLDGEDPLVVFYLRVAYACMQFISILVVMYTYIQASAVKGDQIVYVPAAPTPFADPNTKKKYTEVSYGAHVYSTARSLVGSTFFGICMTVGLHYYRGMVMGLAIQAVMAPLNLIENPLIKALFLGNGLVAEGRIFGEKTVSELTENDEIVDEQGNTVVRQAVQSESATSGATTTADGAMTTAQTIEEILLDIWDAGSKADLGPLMAALNKKNCNYQTKEDSWTPLMVLAGLGAKGTGSAIRQLLDGLGANPAICDKEGWNALHWAAFHGSIEGAKELRKEVKLLTSKDKEGLTPLELARKENNDLVADIFEAAVATSSGEGKKTK